MSIVNPKQVFVNSYIKCYNQNKTTLMKVSFSKTTK